MVKSRRFGPYNDIPARAATARARADITPQRNDVHLTYTSESLAASGSVRLVSKSSLIRQLVAARDVKTASINYAQRTVLCSLNSRIYITTTYIPRVQLLQEHLASQQSNIRVQ
jgi:hypothetical protein